MIILIVSISLAIIAIVVAIVLINKNNSKTVNDFESSSGGDSGISQTEDTIEYNGFVFNKKPGYLYEMDESVGELVIYNSEYGIQINFLPYSFSTVTSNQKNYELSLSNFGYNPTNMKVSNYSGQDALSLELKIEDKNVLFFIYQLNIGNYCARIYLYSKNNQINYNLISEAINLTSDVTKSSTFAVSNDDENISMSKISDTFLTK